MPVWKKIGEHMQTISDLKEWKAYVREEWVK